MHCYEKGQSRWGHLRRVSWHRRRLSLLLHEARRQRSRVVAEEGLLCALRMPNMFSDFDVKWLHDALMACQGTQEKRELKSTLRSVCAKEATPLAQLLSGLVASESSATPAGAASLSHSRGDPSRAGLTPHGVPSGATADSGSTSSGLTSVGDATDITSPAEPPSVSSSTQSTPWLSAVPSRQLVLPSESFCKYFLHQRIVSSESELLDLTETLRAPPRRQSFHLHSTPYRPLIQSVLQDRDGVVPISWLPPSYGAYEMALTSGDVPFPIAVSNRAYVRRLAQERAVAFQSVSSMLAVFFLNPLPGELVLDACASPGSKASLIVDLQQPITWPRGTASPPPRGGVIANDISSHRVAALVDRFGGREVSCLGITAMNAARCAYKRKFDKVLVDAPCSGESRLGRDAASWRLWHPMRGVEFHQKQVKLLVQAVRCCRPGGRILYSTCTFNPLENEAVVLAVLRQFPHTLRLVKLPREVGKRQHKDGLSPPPVLNFGLSHWSVPSPDGGFFTREAERSASLPASLVSSQEVDKVAADLHLCTRRLLPHKNRGWEGFFYALLEVSESGREEASTTRVVSEDVTPAALTRRSGQGMADARCVTLNVHPYPLPSELSSASESDCWTPSDAVNAPLLDDHLAQYALAVDPQRLSECFGPFLTDKLTQRRTAMQAFLRSERLMAYLNPSLGLGVVGEAVASCFAGHNAHTLRRLGTVVFNPDGELTDEGAVLLQRHHPQSPRVLRLPFQWVQILLHTRVLEVEVNEDADICTAAFGASVEDINVLYPLRQSNETFVKSIPARSLQPLLRSLYTNESGAAFHNAVIMCRAGGGKPHAASDGFRHAEALKSLVFPVKVRQATLELVRTAYSDDSHSKSEAGVKSAAPVHLQFRLLSSPTHRNTALTMLNRLLRHSHQGKLSTSPSCIHPPPVQPSTAGNPMDETDIRVY